MAEVQSDNGLYSLFVEVMVLDGAKTQPLEIPYGLIGALTLGILLSVYSIMQYKNRKFQMKLVQFAMLVQLVFGALIFYYADKMASLSDTGELAYRPAVAVVLVNIILYYLALRGIKKDDALVRSADRLR